MLKASSSPPPLGGPKHNQAVRVLLPGNLLKDVPVKLLLSVPQELADHLPAQAFPLEQEVSHAHGSVWNKASLYQILDAFLWFSGEGERRSEIMTPV